MFSYMWGFRLDDEYIPPPHQELPDWLQMPTSFPATQCSPEVRLQQSLILLDELHLKQSRIEIKI